MRVTLHALTEQECLDHLRSAVMGRVGISVHALPEVLPVNFAMLGDAIVFRSAQGSPLSQASRNAVVAFEVDGVHPAGGSGWSVLVVGRSSEVTDPDEVQAALQTIPDGWVAGERELVFRITTDRLSGRRIHRDH
jgi:nitroimidazol reductase NimA-like FMN-containing flavoprotein (pyridoxamine 5'-phosphate oxidase superfamily)